MTVKQDATQVVEDLIQTTLSSLELDLVAVDFLTGREKKLRVFIERKDRAPVGMEDCVSATRGLDGPLEACPTIELLFPASYELEVSSPGVERPLNKPSDYERFRGERIRVHTFRPLTGEELHAPDFAKKNPKQKNFIGTLDGTQTSEVLLTLEEGKKDDDQGIQVTIPFPLISKAHLEPAFSPTGKESKEGKHAL